MCNFLQRDPCVVQVSFGGADTAEIVENSRFLVNKLLGVHIYGQPGTQNCAMAVSNDLRENPGLRPSSVSRAQVRRVGALASLGAIGIWMLLATAAQADPLRIMGVDYAGDLPTLIAERNGHFAASGTDVTISRGASGSANLAALRAGRTDFALMAMSPLVLDVLADPDPGQPDDPVILANLSHASPLIRILRRDDGMDPADASFAGLRVGVPRGTNADYVWHLFRSVNDIGADDVSVIDMHPRDMAAGFAAGRIDMAVLWNPWARDMQAQLGARIRVIPDAGMYVSRWLLVARRETVAQDIAATRDILAAYGAAVDWIQENPKAALEVLRGTEGATTDTTPAWMMFDVTLDWGLFTSFRQQMIWARSQGYRDTAQSPGFLDLIADAPLAAHSPSAVLLPRSTPWPEGYVP